MSNATAHAAFERELRAEADELFEKDVPRAVVGIALRLRQEWEDNLVVGTVTRVPKTYTRDPWRYRRPGTLKGAVMAVAGPAPKPLKDPFAEPGGAADAEEALAGYRKGQPITVFDNVYWASFVERGGEHGAAQPALLPALQLVGELVVPL